MKVPYSKKYTKMNIGASIFKAPSNNKQDFSRKGDRQVQTPNRIKKQNRLDYFYRENT
jgi:hypothetical protein